MRISNYFIEKPLIPLLLVAAMLAMLVLSYFNLPVEAEPDVEVPYVGVTATNMGATPREMEQLICIPLEEQFRELTELDEIIVLIAGGRASFWLKFFPESDISESRRSVREKVDGISDELPPGTEEITVRGISFQDMPVIMVSVAGPYTGDAIEAFAEEIKDGIEEVEGVSYVSLFGTQEQEILVEVDPYRLRAYGLSLLHVAAALERENVQLPGGVVERDAKSFFIQTEGEFTGIPDIGDVILMNAESGPVYLRDVAAMRIDIDEGNSISRLDGDDAVTLIVHRKDRINTPRVVDRIMESLEVIKGNLPGDLKVATTGNQGRVIRLLTGTLLNNALFGAILVVMTLMVVMGFRNSLMVSFAIPFSLFFALVCLYASGKTLTNVAIFSMILTLGLVVDGAIIVGENIYRHVEKGKNLVASARMGIKEVGVAVIAADTTTIIAFLPMIFMSGVIGQYLRILPQIVIFSLIGSIFVDHIILPIIASRRMKPGKRVRPDIFERFGIRILYLRLLRFSLKKAYGILAVIVLLFVLSTTLLFTGVIDIEFFPKTGLGTFWVDLQMPAGASREATLEKAREVERIVRDDPSVEHYVTNIGEIGSMNTNPNQRWFRGMGFARIWVHFQEHLVRGNRIPSILRSLQEEILKLTGAEIEIHEDRRGPPMAEPVVIHLSGEDLDMLHQTALHIEEELSCIEGVVSLKDSHREPSPRLSVKVEPSRAGLLGVNSLDIARTIGIASEGYVPSKLRIGGEQRDIRVRLRDEDRGKPDILKDLIVYSNRNKPVLLGDVTNISWGKGYSNIYRLDFTRTISIRADVEGRSGESVLREFRERIATCLSLPAGCRLTYGGENKDVYDSFRSLGRAMAVAVFLIYLLLIAQFQSLLQPLVILVVIPFSLIGVVAGLFVTGSPFGVLSFVGIVGLTGIVVNDAIVLITYFNDLRRRGREPAEALAMASFTRLRPILMTSVTTIAGLLPLTLGIGGGGEFWAPLGWSIIWGLVASTFLTLLVIPILTSFAAGVGRERTIDVLSRLLDDVSGKGGNGNAG